MADPADRGASAPEGCACGTTGRGPRRGCRPPVGQDESLEFGFAVKPGVGTVAEQLMQIVEVGRRAASPISSVRAA